MLNYVYTETKDGTPTMINYEKYVKQYLVKN